MPASNFHGQVVPRGALEADGLDHVAAAEERRHRLEDLAAAVQDADAGRAVGLVPGPGVEVGADGGDVDGDLRHGLRAVDDGHGAGGAGAGDDLGDGVDRPERRSRRARR